MYEIKETKVNDSILFKLNGKLKLMPDNSLNECKFNDIILALSSEGKIISIALTSPLKELRFGNFQDLLPLGDFYYIKDNILPTVKIAGNGIFLDVIESVTNGLGAGTQIVEHLKNKYNSILLFSDGDADCYWLNNGFERIGTGFYLWMKTN